MQTFTKDLGKEMLQLFPHWEAVACDKDNKCYWFTQLPEKHKFLFSTCWINYTNENNFVGYYKCPDWENSLVTRGDLE
jgi:hypothetical protein